MALVIERGPWEIKEIDEEEGKERCEGCDQLFDSSELENINYRSLCDKCYRFEEELDEAINILKNLKKTFEELGFDIKDFIDNIKQLCYYNNRKEVF